VSGASSVANALAHAIATDPGMLEYKLDELIAFRVVEGACVLEAPGEGTTQEFPARFLPILMHFVDWAPLSGAFLVEPPDGGAWPLAEAMSLLREFIDRGVLISRAGEHDESGLWRDVWSKWNPALAFCLASRTVARQPYWAVSELDALLWEKSIHDPQPSSYKDCDVSLVDRLTVPTGNPDTADRPDDFLSVLLRRRTCRSFSEVPVQREDIASLLYLTWGATTTLENHMGRDVFLRKTSPSGGSLHPTEVYPLIMNVDGIERGVYHYSVRQHGLERLSDEDPRKFIVDACGGQPWVEGAAAVFLTTSVVRRVAWKYESPRAFRAICQDVGHLSQTFYLVATWLGLGAFVTGALRDEVFEEKIGLDYLQEPVLLLNGVGMAATAPAAATGPSRG
jgi:SagB-type dehydrogenase family enzyme